jgi:hypothetical protein
MTNDQNEKSESAMAFLNFLHSDENVFEVRILGAIKPYSEQWEGYGTPSGYYKSKNSAVNDIVKIDTDEDVEAKGIYVTLNPVHQGLLSRANERFKGMRSCTNDSEITLYQNLLLDFDPKRFSNTNSTDSEQQMAIVLAQEVKNFLSENGFPDPYYGSSGNGAALIYKLDRLPNERHTTEIVKTFITMISKKFSTDDVDIDTSVFNPSRLVRIAGTKNRKGDYTEDRPQRYAEGINIPPSKVAVKLEQLKNIIAIISSQSSEEGIELNADLIPGAIDIARYLNHNRVEITGTKKVGDSFLYLLKRCVFNEQHTENESAIGQQKDGALFYQCFHTSCKDKRWEDARKIISGDVSLDQFIVPDNEAERYEVISATDILSMPRGEMPEAIENILFEGEFLLITGESGIGKSLIVMDNAISFALGTNFLQTYRIPQKRNVLICQSENPTNTIQCRINAFHPNWIMGNDNPMNRIKFMGINGCPQVSGPIINRNGNYTAFAKNLISVIEKNGINVLIFDPLISYHGSDENDNTAMRLNLDAIGRISRQYKMTVILTHHHSKSGGSDYKKARGASAITDWASVILTLIKEKGDKINGTWTKVRSFAKPNDPITYRIVNGPRLEIQSRKSVESSKIEIVKIFNKHDSDFIESSKTMISLIQETFKISRDKANVILKQAINDQIILIEPKPGNKRVKIFKLPDDPHPGANVALN